jgi:hypothetical protein
MGKFSFLFYQCAANRTPNQFYEKGVVRLTTSRPTRKGRTGQTLARCSQCLQVYMGMKGKKVMETAAQDGLECRESHLAINDDIF